TSPTFLNPTTLSPAAPSLAAADPPAVDPPAVTQRPRAPTRENDELRGPERDLGVGRSDGLHDCVPRLHGGALPPGRPPGPAVCAACRGDRPQHGRGRSHAQPRGNRHPRRRGGPDA